MPFDATNTITINAVPADKRTERGPVLRGEINIDPDQLRGWDGVTPLKCSLWLRQGVSQSGAEYKFWSGPIEVDEYRQDRANNRSNSRAREEHERDKRDGYQGDNRRGVIEDEDIPF